MQIHFLDTPLQNWMISNGTSAFSFLYKTFWAAIFSIFIFVLQTAPESSAPTPPTAAVVSYKNIFLHSHC